MGHSALKPTYPGMCRQLLFEGFASEACRNDVASQYKTIQGFSACVPSRELRICGSGARYKCLGNEVLHRCRLAVRQQALATLIFETSLRSCGVLCRSWWMKSMVGMRTCLAAAPSLSTYTLCAGGADQMCRNGCRLSKMVPEHRYR